MLQGKFKKPLQKSILNMRRGWHMINLLLPISPPHYQRKFWQALMMIFQHALELWNVIATTYSRVSEAKFLQLKRQFQDIKCGTRSVLEYKHEIKNVNDQLAIIGHQVSDKEDLKAKLIQHEASRVQQQELVHSGIHNVLVIGAQALHGSRPRVWNSQAGMGKGILPTPNTNAQANDFGMEGTPAPVATSDQERSREDTANGKGSHARDNVSELETLQHKFCSRD
ncbi:hypothetical protein EJ110_NYTH57348 [Nymphaea thermarum]|nr:hypothetical protein EJ110_NYTH57348 [Nymphaea thermarum]